MEKVEFWKDKSNQEIDPALFSEKAEALALAMMADHKELKKNPNKRSQIRKFFDEVVRLDMTAKSGRQDWTSVLPLVHMLTAKAAYARGRELVSDTFLKFIKESVDQVETQKDLNIFSTFFEAFIGFYRMHGPSN